MIADVSLFRRPARPGVPSNSPTARRAGNGDLASGSRPGRKLLNLTPAAQLRAGRLPLRLLQLFAGLTLFGASMSLMIRGGLGMLPWDVLHYGLATHLPFSIGTIVILTAVAVLLMWVPLRQAPGLGTVANAIWIGLATDATLHYLPAVTALPWQVAFMSGGIVLNGVATAMYIGSQLGPGPRDGLMTGLARVTGGSLRLVRTGLEVAVVSVGWLLGGVVGLGTLLFALSIGPLTQFFLPFFIVELEEGGVPAEPGVVDLAGSQGDRNEPTSNVPPA